MPCKKNKEADGACRVAHVAGEIIVVLDNTGLLQGVVNIVTRSVACSHICTRKEGDISKTGDVDNADGSMEGKTLKEE